MKELLPCKLCGSPAKSDWLVIDIDRFAPNEGWCSFYISCSSEECDTMLSIELDRLKNKKHRALIEGSLRVTWNHINE